jgi:probable HAF family extracellular repeat protein
MTKWLIRIFGGESMRKLFSIVFSAVLLLIVSGQETWAQKAKVYDLGTYPGGTWAEVVAINDFGLAGGDGDTGNNRYCGASGDHRPVGVPLFGPQAMQWFDLGTFGGKTCGASSSADASITGIADTGLIVGLAPLTDDPDPTTHAFVWTPKSGKIDIGTLEALGYQHSNAIGVNKLGTLVVGWSAEAHQPWLGKSLPVVWRPSIMWGPHGWTTTWKIQKLETTGFEQFPHWYAVTVNDSGQIIGSAFDDSGNEIAVLWNPLLGGNGWKIEQLDGSPDYPIAWPNDINERGEIVGDVATTDWNTALPALWKPVGNQRKSWNLTVLPALSGLPQGWNEARGLNDLGDIVGDSNDADGNWLAARWSTKDPGFIRVLGFPGDWSTAARVNNYGIAAGGYGVGDNPERAVAVKFR